MGTVKITSMLGVSVVVSILFFAGAGAQEVTGYTVITATEVKKMQESGQSTLVIAALPASGFKQGHIPDSKQFEFPNGKWINGINRRQGARAKMILRRFWERIRESPLSSIARMRSEYGATPVPVGHSNRDTQKSTGA